MSHGDSGLGDEAFDALYAERAEELLAFFARRSLDPQTAADLTAETFAQALSARGGFDRARGEPAAWLYGIARHQLGRYLRSRRVERAARDRLGMPERPLSAGDLERVEALIDLAEVGRRVRSALDTLTSDQREAVVLRVIDELAYAEIARRLDLSEEAVRARVSRGLRDLAVRLGQDFDEFEEATT